MPGLDVRRATVVGLVDLGDDELGRLAERAAIGSVRQLRRPVGGVQALAEGSLGVRDVRGIGGEGRLSST